MKGLIGTFQIFKDIYFFDFRHRIETGREIYQDELDFSSEDATYYAPVYPSTFKEAISSICDLNIARPFWDFGCGKGRALILAKKAGFVDVNGIELSKQLYEHCCQNVKKTGGDSINIELGDVTELKVNKPLGVIFFYNPFNNLIMERTFKNLFSQKVIDKNTNIIYVNPVHENTLKDIGFERVFHSKKYQPVSVLKLR